MRLIFLHVVFLVDVMPVHQSTLSSQHWHTRLILCPSHAVKPHLMDVLLECKKRIFLLKRVLFYLLHFPEYFCAVKISFLQAKIWPCNIFPSFYAGKRVFSSFVPSLSLSFCPLLRRIGGASLFGKCNLRLVWEEGEGIVPPNSAGDHPIPLSACICPQTSGKDRPFPNKDSTKHEM